MTKEEYKLRYAGKYKGRYVGRYVAYNAEYQRTHPHKTRYASPEAYLLHVEKTKEWRRKNLNNVHAWNRVYAKKHPEVYRMLSKNRRARELGAVGTHTDAEWIQIKRRHAYLCAMCGEIAFNKPLTEDHIIPLSKGGSNFADNIQPLCHSCNAWKKDRILPYAIR